MFQGEGYDCAKDTFNGDGLWSNVAGQREWVESQMMEGLTLGLNPLLNSDSVCFYLAHCLVLHHFLIMVMLWLGEVRLQGGTGEVSGDLAKGNVYLDGHPVCDAGWSQEDALVACRL